MAEWLVVVEALFSAMPLVVEGGEEAVVEEVAFEGFEEVSWAVPFAPPLPLAFPLGFKVRV